MRLNGDVHLTYCTNVHPGESWAETRAALGRHLPAVKARVAPAAPFGVGLRLSARAAGELEASPAALAEFRAFLDENGLYVFTLNGFPYGAFHGGAVKQKVYRPDWSEPDRLRYTDRLACLLAALLPEGVDGSISTVPVGYGADIAPAAAARAAENLRRHADTLARLRDRTGRAIALALEPEPDAWLDGVDDAVRFLEDAVFAGARGAGDEDVLRRHLGVCLDACHAAVLFDEPLAALARLEARGIAVPKIQLSCALRIPAVDAAATAALGDFADGVYLHQVVERSAAGLRRFPDLPAALAAPRIDGAEWRVHLHVPVWAERLGPFETTRDSLAALLARLRRAPATGHLEVETYTWSVLPAAHRGGGLDDDIARELQWAMAALS